MKIFYEKEAGTALYQWKYQTPEHMDDMIMCSDFRKFWITCMRTENTENCGKVFQSQGTVKYVFVTDVPVSILTAR